MKQEFGANTKFVDGAGTIFNSPLHEYRPVVFVATAYYNTMAQETEDHIQLLDYTLKNTWEYCKHDFRLIKVLINCKKSKVLLEDCHCRLPSMTAFCPPELV